MRWACLAALASTMVAVVGLTSLVACSRPAPTPRKVSPDELRGITPANAVDLGKFASRLEKIVVRGEIKSLENLWLTAKDLEGCKLTRAEVSNEQMVSFAQERLEEFQELAPTNFADDLRVGKVLTTNRWDRDEPTYMKGVLGGDACPAHRFGRINVVISPDSGEADAVEHRFNALQIGGRWKLFWYLPVVSKDCSRPRAAKKFGCTELAKAG